MENINIGINLLQYYIRCQLNWGIQNMFMVLKIYKTSRNSRWDSINPKDQDVAEKIKYRLSEENKKEILCG